MAQSFRSDVPKQAAIVIRSESLSNRLASAISIVLGSLSKEILQAIEKAVKHWEKEPDPSPYIEKIAKVLFNARKIFETRVGKDYEKEWNELLAVAMEQCGHDHEVLEYVFNGICARVTTSDISDITRNAITAIRSCAFDREKFESFLREQLDSTGHFVDKLKALREAVGVEDTRESRRLFEALGQPKESTKALAIRDLPSEVRAIMPVHVPVSAIVKLSEVTDPMARAVLSGDLKLRNVPPYFYLSVRQSIEDAVVLSTWKEALAARIAAEFGPEMSEPMARAIKSFYDNLAVARLLVENEPGMEKWREVLEYAERSVVKSAYDYVTKLSFAYSRISLEHLLEQIMLMTELFSAMDVMNKSTDIEKLLELKIDESGCFGLIQHASFVLQPDSPHVIDGLNRYDIPIFVSVMENQCYVSTLDGKVLRVMRDLPDVCTVATPAALLYANKLIGVFKVRTDHNGHVHLLDTKAGASIEAKLRVPGLPPNAMLVLRVADEEVSIEHEGINIKTVSLSELRSPPILHMVDNARHIPRNAIMRLRAPNANFYIQTSVEACHEVPIQEQAALLPRSFHVLCSTYNKDNASSVLLFTEDIYIVPQEYATRFISAVETVTYSAARTKSGAILLIAHDTDPIDVAVSLVHEDGHGYAEQVFPRPFSRYFNIDATRQLLGMQTIANAFEEEVQEVFAELCVLRFAKNALDNKVLGYDELEKWILQASFHIKQELKGLQKQMDLGNLSYEGINLVNALSQDFNELNSALNRLKEIRASGQATRFDSVQPCIVEAIKKDSYEGQVISLDHLLDHKVVAAEKIRARDLEMMKARQSPTVGRKALPSPHAVGLQPIVEEAVDFGLRKAAVEFEAAHTEDEIAEHMELLRLRKITDKSLVAVLRKIREMHPEKYPVKKQRSYTWPGELSPFDPWNSVLVLEILSTAKISGMKLGRGNIIASLSVMFEYKFELAELDHPLFKGTGKEFLRRYKLERDGTWTSFRSKVGVPDQLYWRDIARIHEKATISGGLRFQLQTRERCQQLLLSRRTDKGGIASPYMNNPRRYVQIGLNGFLNSIFTDINGELVSGKAVLNAFGGVLTDENYRALLTFAGFETEQFDINNVDQMRAILSSSVTVTENGISPIPSPTDFKSFRDTVFWHPAYHGNGLTFLAYCNLPLNEDGYRRLMGMVS